MRNETKLVITLLTAGFILGGSIAASPIPLRNEPAIISMKKYIGDNIANFECKVKDDDALLVTTYSYEDVTISQIIARGQVMNNIVYKLNDVEIDIDIGRHLFLHLTDKLKEHKNKPIVSDSMLNRQDSCKMIEHIIRSATTTRSEEIVK